MLVKIDELIYNLESWREFQCMVNYNYYTDRVAVVGRDKDIKITLRNE